MTRVVRWCLLLAWCTPTLLSASAGLQIDWQDLTPATFERSRAEGKPVLLNLEAVWCHWCHVMDQTTYADAKIIGLINTKFIAVKVDHDARPDIANRYRRYGWPATIFYLPDGTEAVKKAGYIDAKQMAVILEAVADQPAVSSEPAAPRTAHEATLSQTIKSELIARHHRMFDSALGGLKTAQKYLDEDSVELALALSRSGDAASTERVKLSLRAATRLIDPAWGGAYQYSTQGDWAHPHYEKLMRTQARYLKLYALSLSEFKDTDSASVIDAIARYLTTFLRSPSGAFYVSQDADLNQGEHASAYFALSATERLELGIPRIDTHIYAEANGRAIEGLSIAATATGRADLKSMAVDAARAMLESHRRTEGGFLHSAGATDEVYLADNLWMARGLVALYETTSDTSWLEQAEGAMAVINNLMRGERGFLGGVDNGTPIKPIANLDENIGVARLARKLCALTRASEYQRMFEHAFGYLADPSIALSRVTEAGILLAAGYPSS